MNSAEDLFSNVDIYFYQALKYFYIYKGGKPWATKLEGRPRLLVSCSASTNHGKWDMNKKNNNNNLRGRTHTMNLIL